MTFASAITKNVSERFMLVKVVPRKYLTPATLVSANTYTFVSGLSRVDDVQINGSDADVTSFSFNASTGVLTVVSSVDLTNTANIVTVDFYVFLTGSKTRYTYGNTAYLPEEEWLPLINNYPSWAQSMRSIADGVFSLANTQIDLITTDRWMQELFGEFYSWNKAPVTVWACVDSTDNNQIVFTGEVVSIVFDSKVASLSVIDTFQKLNATATFGTLAQSYALNGSSYTPFVQPADQNKAIPLVIGKSSPLIVSNGYRISEAFGTAANTTMSHLSNGLRCIPVSDGLENATSVTFLCGRVIDGLKDVTFGTISAAYEHFLTKDVYSDGVTVTVYSRLIYLNCSAFTGEIGDYVKDVGGTGLHGWCCRKETFTHASTTFNVAFTTLDYFFANGSSTTSGSISIPTPSAAKSISLWIDGSSPANYQASSVLLATVPEWAIATYSGHYIPFTLSYGTPYTIGGRSIVHVYATVTASNASYLGTALPGKFSIKCRFSPSTTLNHSEAMEFAVLAAGMDIESGSFTDAATYLTNEVSTCVPSLRSSEFPSYLQFCQSITTSTLGILRTNENRRVQYFILDNRKDAAVIGSKDRTNMLESKTKASIEYQDICSRVIFNNENYVGVEALSTSSGPSATVDSTLASSLHRVDKVKMINHVLTNIYNRKDVIAGYIASPTVEYNFATASEDLNSNIADMVDFDNPVTADSSSQTSGMITELTSSGSETNVKINELRGI